MKLPADVRYALRSLAQSPVFAAVAILSLALGIGANTGMFSMLDQVLVGTLPVRDPGSLVELKGAGEHYGANNGLNALSYPMYTDIRDQNQVFSGMLARCRDAVSISFAGRSERAAAEWVSGTYFPLLGLQPVLGRLFTPDDDRVKGGAPYVVLSYDYWRTRFSGDTAIIGQQMLVNDHRLTIVGVAPRGFDGMEAMFAEQLYVPIVMTPVLTNKDRPLENRRTRWVQVFGRLKPRVSAEQARASLAPIFHRILEMEVRESEFARASPYTRQQFLKMSLELLPGAGGNNIPRLFLEAPVLAMGAMVWLVLLIACANVANLMIARSAARQKEVAVRLAMGASRARVVRHLMVESLILAVAGGIAGFFISPYTMYLMVHVMPAMDPPLRFSVDPSMKMFWYNMAISVVTALIFGLAPALQATRADLAPVLKDNAGAILGGGQARWRKMLVVVQVSLSLLLLIAAGLFGSTLRNLRQLSPGFETGNLLSFSVDTGLNGYKVDRARIFFKQLTQNLGALPGAQAVALCTVPPLNWMNWDEDFTVEGHVAKPGEDDHTNVNNVSPGYFAALGIPIYAGRDFRDSDSAGSPPVAIVNEKFARFYFRDSNPIGRHLAHGADPGTKPDIEIVGVVRDTKYMTMKEPIPREVYFPYLQMPARMMTAYVRTPLPPEQVFPILRSTVRQLDPNLPVYSLKTVEKQKDDSLAIERLAAVVSTSFGGLATVLASIGLYGVMAFLVTRRTREIGIRMALGATGRNVVWLVVREILILVGIGVAVGLPAALGLTRLLASQLYGIAPHDPLVIVTAILGLGGVGAISGYLPAWRATRVDPTRALRYE